MPPTSPQFVPHGAHPPPGRPPVLASPAPLPYHRGIPRPASGAASARRCPGTVPRSHPLMAQAESTCWTVIDAASPGASTAKHIALSDGPAPEKSALVEWLWDEAKQEWPVVAPSAP